MRLSILFASLVLASTGMARSLETNAERLARGLPPLSPARRSTPVEVARRTKPSGIHKTCNSGSLQCCNSVSSFDNTLAKLLSMSLGLVVPSNVPVGLNCSPLAIGGHKCTQQSVCCENNSFDGVMAVGCSPVIL